MFRRFELIGLLFITVTTTKNPIVRLDIFHLGINPLNIKAILIMFYQSIDSHTKGKPRLTILKFPLNFFSVSRKFHYDQKN